MNTKNRFGLQQLTKYPLKVFWMTTAASASRSRPQLHGRTCDSSPAATAVTEGLRPPSATLCLGFAKLHRLFSTGGRPPPAHAALCCSLRPLSPSFLVPASTFLSHLIARPMACAVVRLAAPPAGGGAALHLQGGEGASKREASLKGCRKGTWLGKQRDDRKASAGAMARLQYGNSGEFLKATKCRCREAERQNLQFQPLVETKNSIFFQNQKN